ncbi:MAG TPA: sigma-70 family RNA polymerase sigma factor [Pirellulales bacterium]|jgi:RNA polymerase sigma-70 factor (ECF subfamily)|nr:sigma-70 family RNA polymerase sigma factor [Pirellulales bacterium]
MEPEAQDAWVGKLLDEHQARLMRYAWRLTRNADTARDVVQEAFLRLCRQRPAEVAGHELAWLYRVCRQRALDDCRKERRMSVLSRETAENCPSPAPPPSAAAETADNSSQLLELVARLSPQQQEVVRLKFTEGLKYREIADVLGLTTSHVGVLIHTALKQLRSQLAADLAQAAGD